MSLVRYVVEQIFRIAPPMCITKADVDFAVTVLRRAIQENVH